MTSMTITDSMWLELMRARERDLRKAAERSRLVGYLRRPRRASADGPS